MLCEAAFGREAIVNAEDTTLVKVRVHRLYDDSVAGRSLRQLLQPITPLGPRCALNLLTHLLQHFLHIHQMAAGHFPRILCPPLNNRQVQLAMLTDQHVARFAALLVHPANVGHHVAL